MINAPDTHLQRSVIHALGKCKNAALAHRATSHHDIQRGERCWHIHVLIAGCNSHFMRRAVPAWHEGWKKEMKKDSPWGMQVP